MLLRSICQSNVKNRNRRKKSPHTSQKGKMSPDMSARVPIAMTSAVQREPEKAEEIVVLPQKKSSAPRREDRTTKR